MVSKMNKFRYSVVKDNKESKKLAVLTQYAFYPSPTDLKVQELYFDYSNDCYIVAVYDEDRPDTPIATATSIPMTQNLRGKIFSMDGIANVATEPAYRRKHLTATMMQMILENDKKTGVVLSTLYPFKESFYARFGYITLPQVRIATLSLDALTPLLTDKSPLPFEKVDYKENFSILYDFLVENQKHMHGMCLKSLEAMKLLPELRNSHLVFMYDTNKKIEGCLVYTTKGFQSDFLISTFLYLNSHAKYNLLRFLAVHIDQFFTVKFPLHPSDHPENWLNDLRIQIANRDWVPSAMARVIDVEGLQDLPVGTGSVALKIEDTHCSWNNNIYEFTSSSGKLQITKKADADKTDCVITIEGLTALVYGWYVLEDFEYRKWIKNANPDVLFKLQELFPINLPYMYDRF